jgi:SAM-dependent methyltransferase
MAIEAAEHERPAVTERPTLTPEMFDNEFSKASESAWLRAVFGEDLPAEVEPFSFITTEGLQILAEELSLANGRSLVDLACGRGGPGIWLAKTTGASIVGVDFSPVGVEHARRRAKEFAPDTTARYVVADAADTGLPPKSADALVCIDAIQLMPDAEAVAGEIARVLKVGGRAGLTTWEDERIGDVVGLLESVGLTLRLKQQRDDWRDRERSIFERAQREAPASDDPGLLSLAEEAERALPMLEAARRVIVIVERTTP